MSTNGNTHHQAGLGSDDQARTTRTVAIIKTHALDHRFEIEKFIVESKFEIVKERQMEFDTETDPDTFHELFGEDASSLGEGPVWVYVLERRRAVEVWNSLMGHKDPAIARTESPNSLRARYGLTRAQNGIMGSSDAEIAEIQIASLFASSPLFPIHDLPPSDGPGGRYGSMRSAPRGAHQKNGGGSEPSTVGVGSNGHSTHSKRNSTVNGGSGFKARALPTTHVAPDIAPRTTKAAALRAGMITVEQKRGVPNTQARAPLSKERLQSTFANVPGHKRAAPIAVASTAAPTIAPRTTKAAALRAGTMTIPPPPGKRLLGTANGNTAAPPKRTVSAEEKKASTFEGVPGHKRRETISVASVQAPTMAPRLNKAASMRQTKESAPPSSFQFRGGQAATLGRSNSLSNQVRSSSRQSMTAERPRPSSTTPQASRPAVEKPASVGAPTIAPRQNRSAILRAAKMEAAANPTVGRRKSLAF